MLSFRLLYFIALLSTWRKNTIKAYISGIQHNSVTLDDLATAGCRECFSVWYSSHRPTVSDIYKCIGPYLFVGALIDERNLFELGAYGKSADILLSTPANTTNLSNGVHWYFSPGYSFGFLNSGDLTQNPLEEGTSLSDSRMLWSLIPTSTTSNEERQIHQNYRKTIFNCPDPESISFSEESLSLDDGSNSLSKSHLKLTAMPTGTYLFTFVIPLTFMRWMCLHFSFLLFILTDAVVTLLRATQVKRSFIMIIFIYFIWLRSSGMLLFLLLWK